VTQDRTVGLRDRIRSVVGQFFALLSQSSATGSRSTVMQDCLRVLAIVVSGFVVLVWLEAPQWVLALAAFFAAVVVGLCVWAYVYFAVKQPDALRSEKFTIDKMRIERGVMGDSVSGFRETTGAEVSSTLAASSQRLIGGGE
jgi:hypothetical protein